MHAFVINAPAAASLPRASARFGGTISTTSSSSSSSSGSSSRGSRTSSDNSMMFGDARRVRSAHALASSSGLSGREGGVGCGSDFGFGLGGSFCGGVVSVVGGGSVGGGGGGGRSGTGGGGHRARAGQRGPVASTTTTTTTMMVAGGGSSSSSDSDGIVGSSSSSNVDSRGVGADVGSLGGGVWDAQEEEEWEFEEEVQALEERLEKAVKREDYKGAALCRDELYRWERAGERESEGRQACLPFSCAV